MPLLVITILIKFFLLLLVRHLLLEAMHLLLIADISRVELLRVRWLLQRLNRFCETIVSMEETYGTPSMDKKPEELLLTCF